MKGIKVRIRIRDIYEKDIAFIYDVKELCHLFSERPFNNPFELGEGSLIDIAGEKYKVLNTLTKFANIVFDAKDAGIKRIGQYHPFDFQITYVVELL